VKDKKLVDEVGRLPDDVAAYYVDQLSFYTNRKKKIEKHIADKKKVGLPVTELDYLKVEIEAGHVEEFENRLEVLRSE